MLSNPAVVIAQCQEKHSYFFSEVLLVHWLFLFCFFFLLLLSFFIIFFLVKHCLLFHLQDI